MNSSLPGDGPAKLGHHDGGMGSILVRDAVDDGDSVPIRVSGIILTMKPYERCLWEFESIFEAR